MKRFDSELKVMEREYHLHPRNIYCRRTAFIPCGGDAFIQFPDIQCEQSHPVRTMRLFQIDSVR